MIKRELVAMSTVQNVPFGTIWNDIPFEMLLSFNESIWYADAKGGAGKGP